MSRKYKIRDQDKLHFVTFTVINWIDVFIRNEYRNMFLESVRFCQKNKGLEVFAWCIMTSHIHMILGTNGENKLENIIRDLKSFTSRSIRKLIVSNEKVGESRRKWMVEMMKKAGLGNSNNRDFQFWQQHNHPIELSTNKLLEQKLEYIHDNPVEARFVESPEMWQYSSAKDYYEKGKGELDILLIQ